ncbi:hypothetical protein EVAR_85390_1 [Eumeta japonica]|uniref:Uncharacterized protein n=1 Tax=Eumeta variegata TaxID=151549 RepID=A0A4C1SJD8_EUMVA|nr:hypothetical protein EVAR_85390_1 [Eumeta japonica]
MSRSASPSPSIVSGKRPLVPAPPKPPRTGRTVPYGAQTAKTTGSTVVNKNAQGDYANGVALPITVQVWTSTLSRPHRLSSSIRRRRPSPRRSRSPALQNFWCQTRHPKIKPRHPFTYAKGRKIKAVLRNIPLEISTDCIKSDLESQNYPVFAVHRMHRRDGTVIGHVLAVLHKSDTAKDIFKSPKYAASAVSS